MSRQGAGMHVLSNMSIASFITKQEIELNVIAKVHWF